MPTHKRRWPCPAPGPVPPWLQRVGLAAAMAGGLGTTQLSGWTDALGSGWITPLANVLLAVGLYAATAPLTMRQLRTDRRVIGRALTYGVLLKFVVSYLVLLLVFRDPRLLFLALAMTPIDPLSVEALERPGRLSPHATYILEAWASLDDPIMVVATVLALEVTAGSAGGPWVYARPLLVGALIAGLVVALVWGASRWPRRRRANEASALERLTRSVTQPAGVAVAVWTNSMAAVALIGLLVGRPDGRLPQWAPKVAAYLAAAVLGIALAGTTGGEWIWRGVLLGLATYVSQALVAPLVTRGLPSRDRWHLALAHQSGITAILLALQIRHLYPDAASTTAVGIVVVYLVHFVANAIHDAYTGR